MGTGIAGACVRLGRLGLFAQLGRMMTTVRTAILFHHAIDNLGRIRKYARGVIPIYALKSRLKCAWS